MFNDGGTVQNKTRAMRRLTIPVMAWGASDGVGDILLHTVSGIADTVTGGTIDTCGHYIPEEVPGIVTEQLAEFFVS